MKTLLFLLALISTSATADTVLVCHQDGTCELVIVIGDRNG